MKTNPFRYTQGAWSIARAPLTYANVERTMNMTDNLLVISNDNLLVITISYQLAEGISYRWPRTLHR
jgi:hypothetical protein